MTALHVAHALLPSGWASDVSIDIDANGVISRIETDVPGAAPGCLLAGMANLHSHAHQRAMAGLAERSGHDPDSFWTWRTTMYRFLDAMTPDQLQAVAAQLYVEMLKSGYTRVAEFQYLHHQPDGSAYADLAEMSLRTLQAARDTGLGITNLPVYYQFGGFGGQPIVDQQRRFFNEPERFLRITESLATASAGDANVVCGMAAHSLRAVTEASLNEVLDEFCAESSPPVHIHIAEQRREVDDCEQKFGVTPVDYLFDHFDVDENWCLVHATHMTEDETSRLALSGAVAGLCPTTEGNLGDGFFNAVQYLDDEGVLGIGSDSHISISPAEELRWFEYGQRLLHHSRNQLAGGPDRSTGRNLYELSLHGGAQACGHNSGAVEPGRRADLVVLDTAHPLLCERAGDSLIDSWIFSGNSNPVRDVYVGGRHVINNGHHADEETILARFRTTLRELGQLL